MASLSPSFLKSRLVSAARILTIITGSAVAYICLGLIASARECAVMMKLFGSFEPIGSCAVRELFSGMAIFWPFYFIRQVGGNWILLAIWISFFGIVLLALKKTRPSR